ncbi:hypothetical protein GPECTOR_9g690 [Gonium pectorale]|uniref:PUM-HD domain-containing protein n=1 Tax=Gonium pectorale TaxID=33097 RepID=A0A150GRZ6_GONPE|nr:hypothetical protein GPECTOR_9g690 [Gonium pectorale]|eukprot:KXZ52645.1 hypothetical protein GPECTOR_9g690 [Gonium pectorale]
MGAIPGGINIISGERFHRAAQQSPVQAKALASEELGLGVDAEEALRSRPDYVAYYYANVRNNPRLPPPLPARGASWVDGTKADGLAEVQARSLDEQVLQESVFAGSAPHTPMGSQHGGGNPLFGSFAEDSPRPSLDAVGRSISSKSLGAKDRGHVGRIADLRLSIRTPSKLRIGTTPADPDPQQQLLETLSIDADTAAAAAAAAAAVGDNETAAAAAVAAVAAQQLASAAQVQAAVEAIQNLPPGAATAFAAALGGADQASVSGGGQQLMSHEVLLGGAGSQQQQQVQAMYMAAMYPVYYAQQAAGMQHSIQAMQAAAMAGIPVMPGSIPHMLPHAYGSPVLAGMQHGPAAATLFGPSAAGMTADVAALAAAGLRPGQPFPGMAAGGGLMPSFVHGMAPPYSPGMSVGAPGPDYGAYYQKVLEAQAMAMTGGVTKDADSAAMAMLRGGMAPPPPPLSQPPPPPKDKRNSGGEQHIGSDFRNGSGHGDERRPRTNSYGRADFADRANGRGTGCPSPMTGSPLPANGGSGQMAGSPTQGSGMGPGGHGANSRLRASSGPQPFAQLDGHSPMANGGPGGGAPHGHGYPREGRGGADGPPQRRNSQRRDMFSSAPGASGPSDGAPDAQHAGGVGGGSGGGGSTRGPRSSGDTLLDEFKANKTGRKYELREILGHVYEFSLDQHGSRFIQQKLETVSPEDLDAAFTEVLPRILHLMTDVFGNYVVQKFLEHGMPEHHARLAKALHGHVLQLSLQMYGCRVVQKALEVFNEEQQVELISELDGHIMRCVRDQNGNHVIQKCIECVPNARITGVLDNFLMCVVPLSTHPFGCRIIQRILENVRDARRRTAVMADILGAAVQLTQDQYGNYVIQHVLERGTAEERSSIAGSLAANVVQLSMHKFASNVIEKCLTYGSTADRDLLVNRMLGAQALQMQAAAAAGAAEAELEVEDPVQAMMKDQFGNYVVQKVLEVCSDEQRETMLARVRQQLHALKRYTYGKHIVARVEKLLSAGTRYQTHAKGRLLPDDEALAAAAAAAAAGRIAAVPPPLEIITAGSGVDVPPGLVRSNGSSVGGEPVSSGGAAGDKRASDGSGHPSAPTTPPVSGPGSDSGLAPAVPQSAACSTAAGVERDGAVLPAGEAH